jgi:hydroxymethylglutaryl-CoA lyase
MARAARVMELITDNEDLEAAVLVPNLRGAEAAVEAGADVLTFTLATSETYNQRNVRRSVEQSTEELRHVAARASEANIPVDAVLSCAFGSPYEGEISPNRVAALVERLIEAGAKAVTLADTTGMATPRVVRLVLEAIRTGRPDLNPGLHLHETRGTAMLNAFVAMQLGITDFDTSVGGLGGSPFVSSTGGNLPTEDFVALLDDLGVTTGIDIAMLLEAGRSLRLVLGHELPSKISRAGPRLQGVSPPF